MLPVDDAELDALIGEAVAASHQKNFVFVVMAALDANRPVQARHLVHGTALMPNHMTFGYVAWRVHGDATEALAAAEKQHVMHKAPQVNRPRSSGRPAQGVSRHPAAAHGH